MTRGKHIQITIDAAKSTAIAGKNCLVTMLSKSALPSVATTVSTCIVRERKIAPREHTAFVTNPRRVTLSRRNGVIWHAKRYTTGEKDVGRYRKRSAKNPQITAKMHASFFGKYTLAQHTAQSRRLGTGAFFL